VSLPEITDEDRAVAAEAIRLYHQPDNCGKEHPATIAAALVRTGWKPVDPDLILAREVCAKTWPKDAVGFVSGDYDDMTATKAALAAIKAADARRRGDG
jgi:hypothetical protein